MFKDKNRHYGLRKLSVGLASVLIGISFASSMNGNSVKADTVESGSNSAQTIVKSSDAATKIDVKDDTNAIESNTESAPEASKKDPNAITQDIKQKVIKASESVTKMQDAAETIAKGNAPKAAAKNATDGGQAAVKSATESTLKGANLIAKQQNTAVKDNADASKDDSSNVAEKDSLTAKNNALKATVEAAKQGLETPAVQHSDGNETTLNVKGSNAITENMLKEDKDNQAGADPAKSKLKLAALLTATGKKLNAQMLSASKVVSPTKDTNDAYALDSKNGLHEHANVNDNGGYDADFWGKINVDAWNYAVNGDTIRISSLKDSASTGANDAVIVPNLDDFKLAGKDGGAKTVYISSSVLGNTAQHKYYGLSKTNGNTFATNSSLVFAFYNNSNLTHADLNSLNTGNVTYMSDMFYGASSLTNLDVSNWNTGNVTNMYAMFSHANSLTSLDVSKWDTDKVTNMNSMFSDTNSLTSLDVSNWNTGNVTDMNWMFGSDSNLTTLDVSNWDTSKVTAMSYMFYNASSLTNLDVSNWDTSNVTNMNGLFDGASSLALIANRGKFADYLVKNNFANSRINSGVKSVTTDNAKLLQLLTNDVQHNSATRTIVFTFPANYSPDLAKYHLTKNGSTYQIKQSADYDKPYVQGTVLINATDDITKHHIDTTKLYQLSDTWQPNYDKLVLAHKNADGTVSFDKVQLPKVPGYKAKVTRNNGLLMANYLLFAPEKPETNNNFNEFQFSNKLATNSTVQFNNAVNSNIVVKSDMYQVVNDDHNWQLPVIKSYELKFATNKNQIIFAYTKDKQYNYRFVLTFKDGQYRLATFNKQGELLKTYSIKSYEKLAKIIDFLVLMNIA